MGRVSDNKIILAVILISGVIVWILRYI